MNRLLLPLLLLMAAALAAADADWMLDSVLARAALADPLGTNDTFGMLNMLHKRYLQYSEGVDWAASRLQGLQITTPVTVKLAGFTGEERLKLEAQLSRYLDVLNKNEALRVIGGTHNHKLGIKSRFHVEVTSAAKGLADAVHRVIEKHIDASSVSPYLQAVPYTAVDDVIHGDLELPLRSYVIYLVNPGRQVRNYAYDYRPGSTATADMYTKCLGNSWTGSTTRYLWLDVAAGPIQYGPALAGDGIVNRDEVYPTSSAVMSEDTKGLLLADLASLVWSAAQMLLAPAIRIPVYYESKIEVHFYHIREERESDTGKDAGVDWKTIRSSLRSEGLLLPGQELEFKEFTIRLADCAVCSAVVAQSTKTYTSRVLLDRYSLFVNEYIDSKQMHHLLYDARGELERLAGVSEPEEYRRVVPVYIFDLDTERHLMLDKNHQAMAFKDMVIAMRSGQPSLSEFNCNNRPVVLQNRAVERPVVASLLQTLFGVAPTHLTWSPEHNSTMVDYTWSLGHTPFGPFSDLMSVSFVQRDAARRNVLLVMLNTTIWGADYALASAKIGGVTMEKEAIYRWNLFIYKLQKAAAAISQFDFESALFFIRSSEHDIYAVHKNVYDAANKLEATISCFQAPPFPWKEVCAGISVLLLLLAFRARFKRRRERF